jgi:hypothetical protein
VRADILEKYVVGPQVLVQPLCMCDASKCAADHKAIESRKRSRDMRLMLGDKLPHGVAAPLSVALSTNRIVRGAGTPLFGCGYAAQGKTGDNEDGCGYQGAG